jgi:hypothetical protein
MLVDQSQTYEAWRDIRSSGLFSKTIWLRASLFLGAICFVMGLLALCMIVRGYRFEGHPIEERNIWCAHFPWQVRVSELYYNKTMPWVPSREQDQIRILARAFYEGDEKEIKRYEETMIAYAARQTGPGYANGQDFSVFLWWAKRLFLMAAALYLVGYMLLAP